VFFNRLSLSIPLFILSLSSCGGDNLVPREEEKDPEVADELVAKARLRPEDTASPSSPYSAGLELRPLDRVYLDGVRSYDSRDPGDPSLILTYSWEVVSYPSGANPDDFDFNGRTTRYFDLWLPLAGYYEVKLTITNDIGLSAEDTVGFDAIPPEDLHLQLVWNRDNDVDLHLVNLTQSDALCNEPWDCYWSNTAPRWFTSAAAGTGPNPTLDIDDMDGIGPENINIDTPASGTYRLYVHYYYDDWFNTADTSATQATVRIYVDGSMAQEYRRTLNTNDVWAVADITWSAGAGATVTPYTSDAAGQVGSVGNIGSATNCDGMGGWSF
jgi:hypothetical protein